MKNLNRIITALSFSVLALFATGQQIANLEGINYQAVAIDTDGQEVVGKDVVGKPLYNKEIGVRFTITSGSNGVIYYQETHSTKTNENGLFSLNIGLGTLTAETDYTELLNMPWINGDQWLKVEIALENDGNFELVSNQKFMAVPYAFYTDDIADDAITTEKILDSTILNQDFSTGSVDSRVILDETILAEDIDTGAVTTSEILDSTILNEDVSTGAIDSRTILDETILAEDIDTGAVTTSEILDSTILNEDVSTGAIDSRTILDETIQANDIDTGAVTTSEILNETILAEDIATGAVETSEILNETILAEDIATGAVETDEILNETILAEDIATGAVESDEILNGTILNEDIANGTIDLTAKVTGILPVNNGGTGLDGSVATDGQVLIGNGTNSDFDLANLTPGTGIAINNTPGGIEISSTVTGGVNSSIAGNVNPNMVAAGDTWISPAIPLSGVTFGNIVVGSIDVSLEGCQMTTYVSGNNIIRVAIFNGTGSPINLGNGRALRVLVVQ
jgi:hypothetical protein